MTQGRSLDARIAALISVLADDAPVDIDPLAMARSAATRRHGPWALFSGRPLPRTVVLGLLLAALAAAIAGSALAAGHYFSPDPLDQLTQRPFVAPFVGLPPEGLAPSTPERGELVVAFGGRVRGFNLSHYRMWVFGDGRLIWTDEEGAQGRTLANAVVEQRLTPDGVELVRSRVEASVTGVRVQKERARNIEWNHPGVLWGGLTLVDGDRLLDADWDDRLVGALATPAAWLPAEGWADARISAFVPSRFAVCGTVADRTVLPDGRPALDGVPPAVKALVYGTGTQMTGLPPDWPSCYEVPTGTARSIAATLAANEHPATEHHIGPRYSLPIEGTSEELTFELLPITPDGEVICNCG